MASSDADRRKQFAHQLEQRMIAAGLNQSQLAARAAKFMPDKEFGRASVSSYVRALSIPGGLHLNALARALNCKPEELLPRRDVPGINAPQKSIVDAGNGEALLKIEGKMPWDVALKIMELLPKQ